MTCPSPTMIDTLPHTYRFQSATYPAPSYLKSEKCVSDRVYESQTSSSYVLVVRIRQPRVIGLHWKWVVGATRIIICCARAKTRNERAIIVYEVYVCLFQNCLSEERKKGDGESGSQFLVQSAGLFHPALPPSPLSLFRKRLNE